MEEEKKPEGVAGLDTAAKAKLEKLYYQRELRGLEIKAYSGVLEALRASGKPNSEKDSIIKTLRDYFNVSEERHKAELRLLAYDEKLSLISEKLAGSDFTDEWAFQAQRIYVPLGQQPFSLYRSYPTSFARRCITIRDPKPIGINKTPKYDEDSDALSETELELIEKIIKDNSVCNGWPPEKIKPLSIAVDPGTGNEAEIEEIEQHLKKKLKVKKQQNFTPARSPDITDTPRFQSKLTEIKSEAKAGTTGKSRGVKRKDSEEVIIPPSENVTATLSKKSELSKNRQKTRKPARITQPKSKNSLPPIPPLETKKAKESSEETSSADEGENGPLPMEESSRVMSPVFSEVIRSSVLSRTKVPRGRVDRRKNNTVTSPSKAKAGKARPRTPNQKSGKLKNSAPNSGSRRKSKLNEKLDYDDVLMDLDGNEMEKPAMFTSSSDEVPRRLLVDSQAFDRTGESRVSYKDYKTSEDCAMYSESLPINYNPEDMEQVTDGVFKRPLPPSKGPKPWEIKDARLTHRDESICDENSSNTTHYGEVEVSHQQQAPPDMLLNPSSNINETMSSNTPTKHELPPPPKKQRIKSPLIVNPNINPPNVSKVPLHAPVFSTSLNTASKKRQNNKPISVVDSLNLHLPTSPTASSLAASSSSRRPGTATGGGCSMFSNSSALIAGARGTAPGILQQQRKAQPHILSNSKVHQRATFLPTMNMGSSISNSVNNNMLPPISVSPTFSSAPVPSNSPVTHPVQIPSSPIPHSSISTVPPSSSNSSSINIGGAGLPISHVNRSGSGANIIFVQKSNGPAVVGSQPSPSSVIPLKTPPRAVILRRTQLPRQGNVMILDMQKNQLVTPGQAPPFIQTARILNAPPELSLLNIQPSLSPRKSPPPHSIVSPPQTEKTDEAPEISQQSIPAASSETIHQSESQVSVTDKENNESTEATQNQGQDAEYAQIEAELMQMEEGSFEEVVYEEEVTTEIVPLEDGGNTQYIYTNETCSNAEGENIVITQEVSSHNASSVSGSSTDTASENEASLHHFESPDNNDRQTLVKKVSLSPIDEVKIASDAISRALSLSRSSPAKKLTFSAPITLGTTTFNLTSEEGTPDTITNVIPSAFETSSSIVIEGDSLSTNNDHVSNSSSATHVLQQCQPQAQEQANLS